MCGCYGSAYGSKIWHSNDRYRRTIWQCNNKYKNGQRCTSPHLDEETIKAMFVKMANEILVDRDQIIEDCAFIRQRLFDTTPLEAEANELHDELQVVTEQIRQLVERNAGSAIDQADYPKRYRAMEALYQEVVKRIRNTEDQILARNAKGKDIAAFAAALTEANRAITDFDAQLWNALVKRVEVGPEGDTRFIMRNGDRRRFDVSV